jgi:hypothetical protein
LLESGRFGIDADNAVSSGFPEQKPGIFENKFNTIDVFDFQQIQAWESKLFFLQNVQVFFLEKNALSNLDFPIE